MRIHVVKQAQHSFEFKVEIFSSETCEWRESILSFTQDIDLSGINLQISFAYNGWLYWDTEDNFAIGFDPFMINNTSNGDGGTIVDHYKGRVIEFVGMPNVENILIECLGVLGGCLRFDTQAYSIHVWELKEEEEEEERAVDISGKLCLECTKYSLDHEMFPGRRDRPDALLGFDPNDEDILIFSVNCQKKSHEPLVKFNIRTREWSELERHLEYILPFFQLVVLPWWPTPVPRLPQHQLPHAAA